MRQPKRITQPFLIIGTGKKIADLGDVSDSEEKIAAVTKIAKGCTVVETEHTAVLLVIAQKALCGSSQAISRRRDGRNG